MNLRAYFQKIREVEKAILTDAVYVVSLAGEDGGLAGILSEVTKAVAAKLIVEQRSRLATPEEAEAHVSLQNEMRRAIHESNMSQRLQVAIVSDQQLEAFRNSGPAAKKTAEKKKD